MKISDHDGRLDTYGNEIRYLPSTIINSHDVYI